jgi:xylulokinase
MESFLTIDIGTTGAKVAIISEYGSIQAKSSSEYSINSTNDGWEEQDCRKWWEAVCSICNNINKEHPELMKSIKGIGICGQMHTHVYLDKNCNILRPAITWMDQRAAGIVNKINNKKIIKEKIFKETANIPTTTYTGPQVKWVFDNEPEVKKKTKHILLAKDYIKYLLTGEMITDYSDASGTLLFDVSNKKWSKDMFQILGIPRAIFPIVASSTSIIGKVSKEASRQTGIPEGTPVANGASDNSSAALGTGMLFDGDTTLVAGTAGVISRCCKKPLPDPSHRTLCWNYCLEDKWVTLGVTQTAGGSLNWFKEAFDKNLEETSDNIFSEYNEKIKSVPDGCNGLIFLPYLNGERTPYWDASARGVFFGISVSTSKEYFIKAIMEGVSFALKSCIEAIEDLGVKVKEVRAVGGAIKSPVWLNILSKILSKKLYTVENRDSGLIGNLLILKKALDKNLDLEKEVDSIVKLKANPKEDITVIYKKQYKLFLDLYKNVKDLF